MSLLPSVIVMLVVALVAAANACLLQDAGLSAARDADRQLARQRADAALARAARSLSSMDVTAYVDPAVRIEQVASADVAEVGDLPLVLHRITAAGQGRHDRTRLQADYAIDGCEQDDADESVAAENADAEPPCTLRVRRLAWRELPVE